MENKQEKKSTLKRKRNYNDEAKYKFAVKVRYNKQQYDNLKEKSDKTGIRLAVLIREITLKSNIKITSKYDLNTYNQIRKIGVNINQIAKKINTNYTKYEMSGEHKNLEIFINELRNILNNK